MDNLCNIAQRYIYIKDLSNLTELDLLKVEVAGLDYKNNNNNLISKEMNLLDKDVYINIKKTLEQECINYLNNSLGIGPLYQGLKLTNSWANVTRPGESHHEHVHPFSVVSGVVFLDNNPDNLNLYIEGYMPEVPYFFSKQKSFVGLKNLFENIAVDPSTTNNLQNHLILFLSNSAHFVENTSNISPDRRTISFNTFWSGTVGVKDESLGSYTF
jgi:hypothetical protein